MGYLIVRVFYDFNFQYGPVDGALFADYGTDIGSGSSVPGMCIFYYYYSTLN